MYHHQKISIFNVGVVAVEGLCALLLFFWPDEVHSVSVHLHPLYPAALPNDQQITSNQWPASQNMTWSSKYGSHWDQIVDLIISYNTKTCWIQYLWDAVCKFTQYLSLQEGLFFLSLTDFLTFPNPYLWVNILLVYILFIYSDVVPRNYVETTLYNYITHKNIYFTNSYMNIFTYELNSSNINSCVVFFHHLGFHLLTPFQRFGGVLGWLLVVYRVWPACAPKPTTTDIELVLIWSHLHRM